MDGIAIFFNRQNTLVKVLLVVLGTLVILFVMTIIITKTTNTAQLLFLFISFFSVWVIFYHLGKKKLIFNVLGLVVALMVSFFWLTQPNWLIIDIIGFSIILQLLLALPRISLKNIIIICIGYLIYDGVAVYFLNTMEQIAIAAIDNQLPMLIIIPKTLSLTEAERIFALGLGDIAIPAILIREELWRSREYNFPKVLNIPLMPLVLVVGYIMGFLCMMVVAVMFRSGQPALIFIIPSMLLCLGLAYFMVGRQRCSTRQ